jgi:acetyl esterase/lipase
MSELPDAVLRYGDHDDAVIDVHLSTGPTSRVASGGGTQQGGSGGGREIVVLVHGGFWKAAWDRRHTRPLARQLAEDGYVVATPEYRRVGDGGGWPTTCHDVRRAVAVLPGLLAAVDVAPARTTLVGHSAGGHLVLWLAGELSSDRVVALAPVCDLGEAARLALGARATQAFMGGEPDVVDYAPADPMVRLAARPAADVVVLHGTRDDEVPVALSRRLVQRHPWVRLCELDCAHYELIDPREPVYEVLRGLL